MSTRCKENKHVHEPKKKGPRSINANASTHGSKRKAPDQEGLDAIFPDLE